MYDIYALARDRDNYLQFVTTGEHKIEVFYKIELDGGGTTFGQDYLPVIKDCYPDRVFNRAYEWCSGPGFIDSRCYRMDYVKHCVYQIYTIRQ
jgi:hypothetical protein